MVWNQVDAPIRNMVRDDISVHIRDQVWNQVRNSIRDELDDAT